MRLRLTAVLWCTFSVFSLLSAQLPPCSSAHRPVVMVHGFLAAGDSWARFHRAFVEAGYCPGHLYAHDWNTLNQQTDHVRALDEAIDAVLASTGARQVDLIGHSAGGGLAYRYLSDSLRAAKVARYVHIGSMRQKQPAGPNGRVPTLNLWSDGDRVVPGGDIEGATNRMLPALDHYQVATHLDAFREVYRFLNDSLPVSRPAAVAAQVTIGGRAVYFGDNKPAAEARIELYYLDPTHGERQTAQPQAQVRTDAEGRWQLTDIRTQTPVELVLQASETARPVHYFFAGFTQAQPWVYLRALPPSGNMSMVGLLLASLPDTSTQAVVNLFLSDQAVVAGRDSLTVDGLELSSTALSPPEKTAISFFLYDDNGNGRTDGTALTRFARFPFLAGVDVFFDPNQRSSVEIYFNGKRQQVRKIPANQGVQVVVF